MTKILHEILNIEPSQANTSTEIVHVEDADDFLPPVEIDEDDAKAMQDMDDDFEKARESIHHVIDRTKTAIEHALAIALDKEEARSFDSVNNLLKTLKDTSVELLDIHKKKQEFKSVSFPEMSEPPPMTNNIQNAVFTGSMSDLRKFAKERKKNQE